MREIWTPETGTLLIKIETTYTVFWEHHRSFSGRVTIQTCLSTQNLLHGIMIHASYPPQLTLAWYGKSSKKTIKESEVAQSCLILCNPMDYCLPGFSVQGIFQGRILEWVAISFSRGSFQPRDWTQVSHIAGRRFSVRATREAPQIHYWLVIVIKKKGPGSWYPFNYRG